MPASIAARHAERLMHAAEVVICEVYGRTQHRRRGSTAGYAVSSCRRAASIFVLVTPGLGPGTRGPYAFACSRVNCCLSCSRSKRRQQQLAHQALTLRAKPAFKRLGDARLRPAVAVTTVVPETIHCTGQ